MDLVKYGATVDPKRYKVDPVIRYSTACSKCANLNHGPKNCRNETRCVNCSETGHTKVDCRNLKSKCANCKGPHPADSEKCPILREKIFNDNSYILRIMVGEKIIPSKEYILRSKPGSDGFENCDLKRYIDNQIDIVRGEVDEKHKIVRAEQLKLGTKNKEYKQLKKN